MVAAPGDIVELQGRTTDGEFLAEKMEVLAPAIRPWEEEGDWARFARGNFQLHRNLELRAAVMQAIRAFFAARGFLEVETPALVRAPGQEAHLQLFETAFRGQKSSIPAYLITSPEHHMKRLLGAGCERIFQICRCYRNGERSAIHHPEFTLLEWYRAYASYEEIMEDVESLVVQVACAVRGRAAIHYQGKEILLEQPWPRISVQQAFAEFAGIDLRLCQEVEALRARALELGYSSITSSDTWEDIFYKLLIEKVEPALCRLGVAFLLDYPLRLAALSKRKEGDPEVAERVEVYLAGLELANGFTELNDPEEQRQRFAVEQQKRQQAGQPPLPLDEDFLAMLARGMPPAGGMALGVDRLAMLLADAPTVDAVIAFPFEDRG